MWSRVVEVMIGLWLAMSPFIFNHPPERAAWWWNDFLCALATIAISLTSFYDPLRRVHLLNVVVGGWLLGYGRLASGYPPEPALQNAIMVGLLLMMFAIIPSHASTPPEGWLEAQREEERSNRASPP